MKSALFLSPHLDDVAFSCGGTLARLASEGWQTVLCTIFTATVCNPTGFALACQLDKGLGPGADYMALRRAEDERFAERIGASEVVHLGLPEAPHRGYGSAPELFSAVRAGDTIEDDVRAMLEAVVRRLQPDRLFAPQGLGGHVDHVHVARAAATLDMPAWWYRDAPYVLRNPAAAPAGAVPALTPYALGIDAHLEKKLDATSAYITQLGFQFGGDAPMREALTSFAHEEATRFGLSGATHAEAFGVA